MQADLPVGRADRPLEFNETVLIDHASDNPRWLHMTEQISLPGIIAFQALDCHMVGSP
jgi:hypothetical protein